MSAEENKDLIRRYLEAVDEKHASDRSVIDWKKRRSPRPLRPSSGCRRGHARCRIDEATDRQGAVHFTAPAGTQAARQLRATAPR